MAPSWTKWISNATALFLLGACAQTHHARLDDAGGLAEESPVMFSGVRVGEVDEVRVVQGQVDIAFKVEREHEIAFRNDSCAWVTPASESGPATLVILPGEGELARDAFILEQCRLPDLDADFGEVIEGVGRTVEGLLRAFGGALSPPQNANPTPPPMPAPAAPMTPRTSPLPEDDASENNAAASDRIETPPPPAM